MIQILSLVTIVVLRRLISVTRPTEPPTSTRSPIAIGDRVEVGGSVGRVAEINLRSTTMVTSDNICIIVPNSTLITGTVINWSHGDPRVRTRLPFGVAYGTNVEKLRAILLEVAAQNPDILKQ